MTTRAEAARLRHENVGARADRPSQRRCAPDQGSPALARASLKGIKVRALEDGAELRISGYATVTETPYEMYDMFGPYSEVVSRDAPAVALSADPDVNFVLNHGGISLARTKSGTLKLAADEQGLAVDATMDPRMPSAQDVRYAMERGDIDEMSFKFRITRGMWSPDYTEYRIDEFDIDRGDVSVVNFGANPFTHAGLRSSVDLAHMTADDLRSLREELGEEISRRGIRPKMTRAAAEALILK